MQGEVSKVSQRSIIFSIFVGVISAATGEGTRELSQQLMLRLEELGLVESGD